MNQITLIGRLTKDIDYSASKKTAKGTVATNNRLRDFKGKIVQEVAFFNFLMVGSNAQYAHDYLKKDSKVFLNGRLVRKYYPGKNGEKLPYLQLIVEQMRFLDEKTIKAAREDEKQKAKNTGEAADFVIQSEDEWDFIIENEGENPDDIEPQREDENE